MLKINNNFKKYKIPLITAFVAVGGAFLLQYLTFIPEYSSAEEISTPVYDETKVDNRTLSDITYMQEMTSGVCERSTISTSSTGDTYQKQLIDGRDGKTYWVAKLHDGRCWMTQDLDFDLAGQLLTTKNDGSNLNKGSDADWDASSIESSNQFSTSNTTVNTQWYERDKVHGETHASLGNLYSFNAATANTGKDTINGAAPSSICPAGWQLPSNETSGSFSGLNMNWANVNISPYYFQMGGTMEGGLKLEESISGSTLKFGYYWSSVGTTSGLRTYGNVMYTAQGGHYLASFARSRYLGCSVRCVNRNDVSDVKIPEIDNPNLSVTVDKILTMKLDSNEVNIEPKNGEIMTGDFGATVSSNADYTLSITAAEGASTSLVNQNDNIVIAEIPTISTETSSLTPNENNWAIRLCHDTNKTNCNNYKPITPYGTTNIFLTNGTPTPSTTSLFEVGIGISPALPSGTYSTNILITASQK